MKILDFLKSRRKMLIGALISFVLFSALFQFLSSRYSIAFTIKGQECFPYKFWLIRKGVIPKKGEYVTFKSHRIDKRATWIKVISGIEGDLVEVVRVPEKDRERFRVFIDEIGRELTVQGYIFLQNSSPSHDLQLFEVFEKDTQGRDLPMIEGGRIPEGKYFVSSPAVRSHDSRYWGLVDESEIIGKAYPIF